ncbi:MAG: T9SS type A sorting domain-containing protein, partial [Cytophagaceae bacterium]|nr:T9SS type A sorting domain-containing protein [Cytophagaceae bacterium]MDW8457445.1 T9SS type A sorting domain-containing protein [Cytophagaceae bacterium]
IYHMCLMAQATFTSGVYTQDFGTSDIFSWTDNTTFVGWYATHPSSMTHANITISPPLPPNTGAFYSYECNGDDNQKIGTRPSNSTPGSPGTYMRYGLRLHNNSGTTIQSLNISFTAYQLSLAENNNVTNELEFHYQTGTTVTSLTSGTYTSVPSLWYTAPNNHPGPGASNQVAGYPCTVFSDKSACINVNIPNNTEIMLRWSDMNNPNNDPHLAIDNVVVSAFSDAGCVTPLPVDFITFNGTVKDNIAFLNWETSNENNNKGFYVEKSPVHEISFTAIGFVNGKSNIYVPHQYSFEDYSLDQPSLYRLAQVDMDGTVHHSNIILLSPNKSINISYTNPAHGFVDIKFDQTVGYAQISIMDFQGKELLQSEMNNSGNIHIDLSNMPSGTYLLKVLLQERVHYKKIIVE